MTEDLEKSMIEVKWFQFALAEVPSAGDPEKLVLIPGGIHLVTFDDLITRAGNPPECEIGFGGPNGMKARILRSTLVTLCDGGHAHLSGDA